MGIAGRLNTTATVKRVVRDPDGQGGFLTPRETEGTISCRISRNSSTERLRANKEEGLGDYTVFALVGVDLLVGDNIEVGSLTWEILSVSRPSRGLHLEFKANLIEPRS